MTDRIDRYVRGELTAEEARQLAQESLDSGELFEELTSSALAKSALSVRSVPDSKVVRFPRKARFAAAGAIAATAAVLAVSLYLAPNQRQETARASHAKPALGSSADGGQPVLLASQLLPSAADTEGTPVFRGP